MGADCYIRNWMMIAAGLKMHSHIIVVVELQGNIDMMCWTESFGMSG